MNEIREIFSQVIAAQTDPGKVADLELCREYFTNETFRKWMEDETARINGVTP